MKITLQIYRFDPIKEKTGHFEKYEVEHEKGMQLLHAIEHARKEIDGTIAYRWNCGAGRCGSCAVEMNGVPVLMCKEEIPEGKGEIFIQPMKVFPAVKDLVVDMTRMREGIKQIPGFKPAKKPFFKMYDYDIDLAKEMKKCIECGICQDVCHVLRDHKKGYIGPRFVAKAASLDLHPADSQNRAAEMENLGIGYCNVTKCCQSACPEKIRITDDAIIPMKEMIASQKQKEFFKNIFGGGKK